MTVAETEKERLLELLRRFSYRRSTDGTVFRLASGKESSFYIDCRATTLRCEAIPLIGALIGQYVPLDVQGVGGLTMGADPIAVAAAYWCALQGRSVHAFSIRKEPKRHGLGKWIEGCLTPGSRLMIVDDVITTGGSTVTAIRRCREEGFSVARVVVLVDREEEGGMDVLRREAGPEADVIAAFTRSELDAD